MQVSKTVLMIEPIRFGFNEQTAESNAFQSNEKGLEANQIQEKALAEFKSMVAKLEANRIEVISIQDKAIPYTPDSIFPNNWVSFHPDGRVVLYPMMAANRRLERRSDILETVKKTHQITEVSDFSKFEEQGIFLEGTGSIVFNHPHKKAYACLSPRTDKNLLLELCNLLDYKAVCFYSHDANGKEIYHTNVMMAIGEQLAIVSLDTVSNAEERATLKSELEEDGLELIEISQEQVNNFAGNMLEVKSENGQNYLVMSASAHAVMTSQQLAKIEEKVSIVACDIETIETYGGGSVRCMLAQVFLPRLTKA